MTEYESRGMKRDSQDVVAEFDSFEKLLHHFASRMSEEGVAVSSGSDFEPGSEVTFELRVRDGFPVLRGVGEVIESSAGDTEGSSRFEHTLRYVHLDPPSVKLLPRLIEHYRKRGLPLLDLPAVRIPLVSDPEVQPATGADTLTLADLEEEFSTSPESGEEGVETTDPESELAPETDLTPELAPEPDFAPGLAGEEMLGALEFTDLAESAVEEPVEEGGDNEIRVDDLMPEEELAVDSDVLSLPEDLEILPEEHGLPWLPEESETKRRSDVRTTVMVAIVVGVLLAVAFYFLVLRAPGRSTQSRHLAPSSRAIAIRSQQIGIRFAVGASETQGKLDKSLPPPRFKFSQPQELPLGRSGRSRAQLGLS